MDYTCIRTHKVSQLDVAAKLSTIQLIEGDEYIRLAMCVEQYIANPSNELFDGLTDQLSVCTAHFDTFYKTRQSLISTLVDLGYLIKNEMIYSKSSTNLTIPIKNNIYNIFNKKPVEKI